MPTISDLMVAVVGKYLKYTEFGSLARSLSLSLFRSQVSFNHGYASEWMRVVIMMIITVVIIIVAVDMGRSQVPIWQQPANHHHCYFHLCERPSIQIACDATAAAPPLYGSMDLCRVHCNYVHGRRTSTWWWWWP